MDEYPPGGPCTLTDVLTGELDPSYNNELLFYTFNPALFILSI
jgi:hypothetical protein